MTFSDRVSLFTKVAFFKENDFMFVIADAGPSLTAPMLASVMGVKPVFLPLHRHGRGDGLGGDVLTGAGPAGGLLFRADTDLLFGAGHRIIGRWPEMADPAVPLGSPA